MVTSLLIWVIVFCVLAYVAWWLCQKFQAPQPVFWLVGAVLLIILLSRVASMTGFHLP